MHTHTYTRRKSIERRNFSFQIWILVVNVTTYDSMLWTHCHVYLYIFRVEWITSYRKCGSHRSFHPYSMANEVYMYDKNENNINFDSEPECVQCQRLISRENRANSDQWDISKAYHCWWAANKMRLNKLLSSLSIRIPLSIEQTVENWSQLLLQILSMTSIHWNVCGQT